MPREAGLACRLLNTTDLGRRQQQMPGGYFSRQAKGAAKLSQLYPGLALPDSGARSGPQTDPSLGFPG